MPSPRVSKFFYFNTEAEVFVLIFDESNTGFATVDRIRVSVCCSKLLFYYESCPAYTNLTNSDQKYLYFGGCKAFVIVFTKHHLVFCPI